MDSVDLNHFIVKSTIDLSEISTNVDLGADKDTLEKALRTARIKLGKIQDVMYAHDKYSVLVCFQGMDTAGKDSMIREVFKDFNSRGITVHSFKQPTDLELSHNYLWRHMVALPEKGRFGIFNRTHYENVLVTRVHPKYILNEKLPTINSVDDIDQDFWEMRFKQILNFEELLAENGTIIFKFFLHLSKDEQKNRLLRRLRKPEKNWKFSPSDLKERELWDEYQKCYQEAINKTSKPHAPWFTIPADNKPAARYIVTRIMLDTLQKYKDIVPPSLNEEILANLDEYKRKLQSE